MEQQDQFEIDTPIEFCLCLVKKLIYAPSKKCDPLAEAKINREIERLAREIAESVPKKMIIVPSRKKMIQRLLGISANPHLQKYFYPLLLKSARHKLNAVGVQFTLLFAIDEYEGILPVEAEPDINCINTAQIEIAHEQLSRFVDALTEDPEIVKWVKECFWKTLFFGACS